VESVVNQFCLTMSSLRWLRNDAAVSAEGALSTRAFVSWLRRHGKSSSVLSRAAPSAVRRRRNMNCYFHISTVFRRRRETLRVFFAIRAGAGLRRDFRRFCGINGAGTFETFVGFRVPGPSGSTKLLSFLTLGTFHIGYFSFVPLKSSPNWSRTL
jgi:hypothetical protein